MCLAASSSRSPAHIYRRSFHSSTPLPSLSANPHQSRDSKNDDGCCPAGNDCFNFLLMLLSCPFKLLDMAVLWSLSLSVLKLKKGYKKCIPAQSLKQPVALLHHQIQMDTCDSPFGIQQIADFLVVDLHVGNLNLKSVGLVLVLVDPLKQRAAEPRD